MNDTRLDADNLNSLFNPIPVFVLPKAFPVYIQSSWQEQQATHIAEKFCLTSSLIPDSAYNSTSSADIYFSPMFAV